MPVLHIGSLAIQLPGLLLILGFWIAFTQLEKQAPLYGLASAHANNLTMIGLAAGITAGRLVYAAQFPAAFAGAWWNLLALNTEMFDLPGALAGAALAMLIYGQRKGLSLWPTLDAFTTLFAVMAVTMGVVHFASGDAFGAPTRLPWGIQLWGETRHPSQIYQTLVAEAIAISIWPRQHAMRATAGVRFLTFTALTATAAIFLETFRGDSILVAGNLHLTQIIAWAVLAAALILLGRRHRAPQGEQLHGSNPD